MDVRHLHKEYTPQINDKGVPIGLNKKHQKALIERCCGVSL